MKNSCNPSKSCNCIINDDWNVPCMKKICVDKKSRIQNFPTGNGASRKGCDAAFQSNFAVTRTNEFDNHCIPM